MFLQKYLNLKNSELYILAFLILFSIFIRIPIIITYGDVGLENEWTLLVRNLINHGVLSFSYHDKELEKFLFPNLYMPPLYAYYIYVFSFLHSVEQSYVLLVLLSQAFLASVSVAIFYKINKFFFMICQIAFGIIRNL